MYTIRYRGPRALLFGCALSVADGICPYICAMKPPRLTRVPSGVPCPSSPSPATASWRSSPGPLIEALDGPLAAAAAGSESAATTAAAPMRYLRTGSPFDECTDTTPDRL